MSALRITLTGTLGHSLTRAVQRLRSHPYSPLFIRSDVSFEMPRIFNAYSGDISGRYIEFFSLYGQMGFPVDDLADLVRDVLKFQQPQGYFGAPGFDKTQLTDKETKIFWGNGRLLIGLLEFYRFSHDPAVLAAAQKLGDFLYSCRLHESTSAIGQAVAADAGPAGFATTFCSCLEGVVRLFEETRDLRYSQLAAGIARLLPETFDHFHSHGRLTALRGMLDLARLTADQTLLQRVQKQWQTIHDQHVTVLGGLREHFGYDCNRDEGCSVADWLMLSLKLFAATQNPQCLAAAERCLFNHLLANQFQNGGFGHTPFALDHVPGHPDPIVVGTSSSGLKEAYWCCSLHAPRALLEAARHLATRPAPDSLDINFIASADLSAADMRLNFLTDPSGQVLDINVVAAPATELTLRLRIPAWAHQPSASLVSDAVLRIVPQGDYLTITRRWKKGDIVRIECHPGFESRPGVDPVQRPYAPDHDALFFGRLLLGYDFSDDLLWGQSMRADTTTLLQFPDRPPNHPVTFPCKTIVEYFDKKQQRTIWAPRALIPVMSHPYDQPLRTVHTIAARPWASLTPAQQAELAAP